MGWQEGQVSRALQEHMCMPFVLPEPSVNRCSSKLLLGFHRCWPHLQAGCLLLPHQLGLAGQRVVEVSPPDRLLQRSHVTVLHHQVHLQGKRAGEAGSGNTSGASGFNDAGCCSAQNIAAKPLVNACRHNAMPPQAMPPQSMPCRAKLLSQAHLDAHDAVHALAGG